MSPYNLYLIFFNKKFKYLTNDEFNILLNVLYGWYYLNHKFPDDLESKHPEVHNLFEKIKNNNIKPYPKKLYRGLSFSTEKKRNSFIENARKTNLIDGKIFRLNQNTRYTSWSASKKIADSFLPGGINTQDDTYGVLFSVDTSKLINDNITFSMSFLLYNEKEIREFLLLVLKK